MTDLSTASRYRIRRKVIKVLGAAFHVLGENGEVLAYSRQKAFRLREDIRVFADESMSTPLLSIRARQIVDWSAAYDVVDEREGRKVGAARRKGFASILRDAWELLDEQDRVVAHVQEDSTGMALLRRFLTNLIPQRFVVRTEQGAEVATLRQRFNPFVYSLEVDVSPTCPVDRRLVLGGAILVAAIEGRQG